MRKRRIDPERELQWYFRHGASTIKSPGFDPPTSCGDPTDITPVGVDCSRTRAGWTTNYGDGWTSEDLAAIEAALSAISPSDRWTLKEHHTPHPAGRNRGLEAAFDIWAALAWTTPTARSRAGSADGTAIREHLRKLVHTSKNGTKEEQKNARQTLRQIRREALRTYIEARDAYESARRLLAAIKRKRKVEQ